MIFPLLAIFKNEYALYYRYFTTFESYFVK